MTNNFLNLYGQPLPLPVYSFSSKGCENFSKTFIDCNPLISTAFLIALPDYYYSLDIKQIITHEDSRIRIWDSGKYEIDRFPAWDKSLYVETANKIPWNGKDVVVNYDSFGKDVDIREQLALSKSLFSQIHGNYVKDVIVHFPNFPNPSELADVFVPYAHEFSIIGLAEKEIAPTWIDGVRFIHNLRQELEIRGIGNLLIHVFGCFDPKTIILFTLAGADIFDGLAWLRYFFLDNTAMYKKELDYWVTELESFGNVQEETFLAAHNIQEIESMRAHLIYAINASDYSHFQTQHDLLAHVLEKGNS